MFQDVDVPIHNSDATLAPTSRIDNTRKQEYSAEYSVKIVINGQEHVIENRYIEDLFFIEDITTFCMWGELVFFDMKGLIEYGPITGNEKIIVTYGDGEEDIEASFTVFKDPEKSKVMSSISPGKEAIKLTFIDSSYYFLNIRKYSYSWKDSSISTIVKDICTKFLHINQSTFGKWEDANETFEHFYIPRWTLKNTLLWLIPRASTVENNISGFNFYQSTENMFKNNGVPSTNFVTFEKLLSNKELLKIYDDDRGQYEFDGPNLFLYNKILSYKISGVDSTAKQILMGGRGYGFDIKRKCILDTDSLKYSEMLSKTTTLGNVSLFPDISETDVNHQLDGSPTLDVLKNIYYSRWIQRYCNQQLVTIEVRGHEKRYCGAMIELKWPSAAQDQVINKNLIGPFLIKSITHHFKRSVPHYVQKLVLIKNGYFESDNTDLLKSTKKNIVENIELSKGSTPQELDATQDIPKPISNELSNVSSLDPGIAKQAQEDLALKKKAEEDKGKTPEELAHEKAVEEYENSDAYKKAKRARDYNPIWDQNHPDYIDGDA